MLQVVVDAEPQGWVDVQYVKLPERQKYSSLVSMLLRFS
jgi:hypothetical protein